MKENLLLNDFDIMKTREITDHFIVEACESLAKDDANDFSFFTKNGKNVLFIILRQYLPSLKKECMSEGNTDTFLPENSFSEIKKLFSDDLMYNSNNLLKICIFFDEHQIMKKVNCGAAINSLLSSFKLQSLYNFLVDVEQKFYDKIVARTCCHLVTCILIFLAELPKYYYLYPPDEMLKESDTFNENINKKINSNKTDFPIKKNNKIREIVQEFEDKACQALTQNTSNSNAYNFIEKEGSTFFFYILRRFFISDYDETSPSLVSGSFPANAINLFRQEKAIFHTERAGDLRALKRICEIFDEYRILQYVGVGKSLNSLLDAIKLIDIFVFLIEIKNMGMTAFHDLKVGPTCCHLITNYLLLLAYMPGFYQKYTHPADLSKKNIVEAQKIAMRNELPLAKARPFIFNDYKGELINPSDGTRNVAFKVTSFKLMLKGLESSSNQEFKNKLKSVGYKTGFSFGRELEKELKKRSKIDKKYYDPKELIQFWFDFDREAGFGRFEYAGFSKSMFIKEQSLIGSITLHNNFLLDEDSPVDKTLIAFIEGYIEGVLNCIFVPQILQSDRRKSDNIIFEIQHESKIEENKTTIFQVSFKSDPERSVISYVADRESIWV